MPSKLMRFRERSDLTRSAIRDKLGKRHVQHRASCSSLMLDHDDGRVAQSSKRTCSLKDVVPCRPLEAVIVSASITLDCRRLSHARLAPLQAARLHASPLHPLSIDWLPNSLALYHWDNGHATFCLYLTRLLRHMSCLTMGRGYVFTAHIFDHARRLET